MGSLPNTNLTITILNNYYGWPTNANLPPGASAISPLSASNYFAISQYQTLYNKLQNENNNMGYFKGISNSFYLKYYNANVPPNIPIGSLSLDLTKLFTIDMNIGIPSIGSNIFQIGNISNKYSGISLVCINVTSTQIILNLNWTTLDATVPTYVFSSPIIAPLPTGQLGTRITIIYEGNSIVLVNTTISRQQSGFLNPGNYNPNNGILNNFASGNLNIYGIGIYGSFLKSTWNANAIILNSYGGGVAILFYFGDNKFIGNDVKAVNLGNGQVNDFGTLSASTLGYYCLYEDIFNPYLFWTPQYTQSSQENQPFCGGLVFGTPNTPQINVYNPGGTLIQTINFASVSIDIYNNQQYNYNNLKQNYWNSTWEGIDF